MVDATNWIQSYLQWVRPAWDNFLWHWDLALFISVVPALLVALLVGWQGRRHNRLSVRPWLQLSFMAPTEPLRTVALVLDNRGLGPAIVHRIDVSIRDKGPARKFFGYKWLPVPTPQSAAQWHDILKFIEWPSPRVVSLTFGDSPSAISAGQSEKLFYIDAIWDDTGNSEPRPLTFDERKIIVKNRGRLRVKVHYKSMYGQTIKPPAIYGPVARNPFEILIIHKKMAISKWWHTRKLNKLLAQWLEHCLTWPSRIFRR